MGASCAGRGCTYAYSHSITQTTYTQYYSTSSEPSLIHMNGRVYAPSLQRFLSPDPVLQAPANAQSHNRYAYCLNNPLRYTDPSGYQVAPLAQAIDNWMEMMRSLHRDVDMAIHCAVAGGWYLSGTVDGRKHFQGLFWETEVNRSTNSGGGGNSSGWEWTPRGYGGMGRTANGGRGGGFERGGHGGGGGGRGKGSKRNNDGVWTIGATATVAAGLLGIKLEIGVAFNNESISPYIAIEHAIGVDISAGIEIDHYIPLHQDKILPIDLGGWSESTNIGLWIIDGTIGGDVKKGGLLLKDRVEWIPRNIYNVHGIGFSIGSPFGFTRNKGYTWIWR